MLRQSMKLSMASMAVAILAMGFTTDRAFAAECKRATKVLQTTIVYFDFDSTAVKPEDRTRLENLVTRFGGNPNLEVCVLGQADKAGPGDYNLRLALRRAEAVADILKTSGLEGKPFQVVSRGEAFAPEGLLVRIFGDKVQFKSDRRVEVL
ncbi:MAG: OmpA family protein, partial [Alphaproteobacteria bacterium]